MARIPYYQMENGDVDKVELLKVMPLNVFLMIAHAKYPLLQDVFNSLRNFANGELDPILREMAIVRTGLLCRADYEVHHHLTIARTLGIDEKKIESLSIGSTSPVFSEIEQLVLRFTEETILQGKATDETFKTAADHFSYGQLVELGLLIGSYFSTCSFLKNFEIDIESPKSFGNGQTTDTGIVTSSLQIRPILEFKDVAGKWEGKMESIDGWSTSIMTTFNEDGTGDTIVPQDSLIFAYTDKGRIHMMRKLVEGKIRIEAATVTGTMTLREGEGKRVLEYIKDDGKIRAIYEPASK